MKYQNMDLVHLAETYGTAEQTTAAREGDTVSGERLCCGLSLFENMMRELQKSLSEDKEWKGQNGRMPANGEFLFWIKDNFANNTSARLGYKFNRFYSNLNPFLYSCRIPQCLTF